METTLNTEGNFEDHIQEVVKKTNNICLEIKVIGSNRQVGPVSISLMLLETCSLPGRLCGLDALGRDLRR